MGARDGKVETGDGGSIRTSMTEDWKWEIDENNRNPVYRHKEGDNTVSGLFLMPPLPPQDSGRGELECKGAYVVAETDGMRGTEAGVLYNCCQSPCYSHL